MLVKVLGAAAGGAFPQWNCACTQCQRMRYGTFAGQPRTQAQVALSEDGVSWTLLNASPDIRTQIEAAPQLWPDGGSLHSPIQSVVLTAAEADTVAGLLSLREFFAKTIASLVCSSACLARPRGKRSTPTSSFQ